MFVIIGIGLKYRLCLSQIGCHFVLGQKFSGKIALVWNHFFKKSGLLLRNLFKFVFFVFHGNCHKMRARNVLITSNLLTLITSTCLMMHS